MPDSTLNPINAAAWPKPPQNARRIHATLPGHTRTPLRTLPDLASVLGVAQLLVKDESARFGLQAYKGLGGSWAATRMLARELGVEVASLESWDDVLALARRAGPRRLVSATDGNHGRGVAWAASLLGFDCTIYMPRGSASTRIEAIRALGATVIEAVGGYGAAVDAAMRDAEADGRSWLLQDTTNPGHEDAPRWCAEGYETLFCEIDKQLDALGEPAPDLAFVQIGVGTLADAMVRHLRACDRWRNTRIVGVEPTAAACVLESVRAGRPFQVGAGEAHATIMAGLNCHEPSRAAWDAMSKGIDCFLAVEDEWAERAMRLLAECAVESGESGAAGLAGLLALLESPELDAPRRALGVGPATRAIVLTTEGATDPVGYERTVGFPAAELPNAARRLAVYGTLAPGKANAGVLNGIQPASWTSGVVEGDLHPEGWGAASGFPAIVPRRGDPRVP
ncbi:MAG: diaminopropionate ammonia-lyase, partial [Phycisphaerales bacterium]